MNLALPVDLYSADQLSEVVLELHDLAAAILSRANPSPHTAELSPTLSELLAVNKITLNNAAGIEDVAKAAADLLDSGPAVHILLAAIPGQTLRRQFTTWFRTHIHPQTLLTFAMRSDLGGGAIVRVGSQVYDLSFRRSITSNKARLTELAGV